ncbi:hypothetical protein [Mesorhizobium sp. M0322]
MVQPDRTSLHIQLVDDVGEAMVREARVEHVFCYGMFFTLRSSALFGLN